MMNAFLKVLRLLVFPKSCSACGEMLPAPELMGKRIVPALCDTCFKKYRELTGEVCERCREPVRECHCLTKEQEKAKCADFRKLFYYRAGESDSTADRLVYRLKNFRDRSLADFFARELMPSIPEFCEENGIAPEELIVTYIPRAYGATVRSGSDQAKQLADALARLTGLPCRKLIFRTHGKQKQQKRLGPAARMKNAKRSFRVKKDLDLDYKSVILVDDLVTTGASMSVCTHLLRRSGAKRVLCLGIASDDENRTPDLRQPILSSRND